MTQTDTMQEQQTGDEPQPPTLEQIAEADKRRRVCAVEVDEALTRHRCRIVPTISSEAIGPDPVAKALLVASFGIQALPADDE